MINQETIHFGDQLKVFQDKKTKVSTVAIPITMISGHNAIISITRLSQETWNPAEDIKSLTIKYKTDENTTSGNNDSARH